MKESELAEEIIKLYEKDGYEIYSEVIHSPGSKRCDIIAVKDGEHIAIEVKKSMNLTLIEQAHFWKDKSHKTYIFFPSQRKLNWFGINMCRDYGIGVYIYNKNRGVRIINESTYCNNPNLPKLYEGQKDSVSGSKGGGYITPFSITKDKLIDHLKEVKECSLNSAVEDIDHHYSSNNSAKQALRKLIDTNVIKPLSCYKKGRVVWVKYNI